MKAEGQKIDAAKDVQGFIQKSITSSKALEVQKYEPYDESKHFKASDSKLSVNPLEYAGLAPDDPNSSADQSSKSLSKDQGPGSYIYERNDSQNENLTLEENF